MRDVFYTRFLLLKKQWPSLLFWILLPILITVAFLSTEENVQDDFTVPIGVVLEEETDTALALYEAIDHSSLVSAFSLHERDAIRKLKKHELDSVFVIRKGYEDNVQSGNRRNLLESFYSERSFAYNPVKELIISVIQQETGRIKAANTVIQLEQQITNEQQTTMEEIITKSKEIQEKEDLLQQNFHYQGDTSETANVEDGLNPWIIWAFATMLVTIFLFDWVTKERKARVAVRFSFTKINYPVYLLINILAYIFILLMADILTAVIFYLLYHESIPIITLVTFRVMVCLFAFLFVIIVRNVYFSYVFAIIWTLLLVVISGSILPFGGLGSADWWLHFINPLHRFLSEEWTVGWLVFCLIGMMIWYIREEKKHA